MMFNLFMPTIEVLQLDNKASFVVFVQLDEPGGALLRLTDEC